jgi:hypothetical protein
VLHGAATDPTAPLPSVADIPDTHQAVRSALGMLREASVYGKGAYDAIWWCCNRLMAANNLHPGLPPVSTTSATAPTVTSWSRRISLG